MTQIDPLAPEPPKQTDLNGSFEVPYTFESAEGNAAPILFASPHSGSLYPDEMCRALSVPLMDLRRTEDAFVEELFAAAPQSGAMLIAARYARSVVDLNRDPRELDAEMFADGLPRTSGLPTARVEAGLGCLPRVGADGVSIYKRLLTRAEGEARLSGIHDAYHARLGDELAALKQTHGVAVLMDCHSMPSKQPGRRHLADIVLGDRFGSSCDPKLIGSAERAFRAEGFSVTRNAPYAGGYTTRRYGRPRRKVHAMQIEINRGLYMDEESVSQNAAFPAIQAAITRVVAEITDMSRLLAPA